MYIIRNSDLESKNTIGEGKFLFVRYQFTIRCLYQHGTIVAFFNLHRLSVADSVNAVIINLINKFL